MWHSPRFYSTTASSFSPTGYVKPFWDDLYAAHAQLIINGHMNDYERARGWWAFTEVSAADLARFFSVFDSLIPARFDSYARSLLARTSTSWSRPRASGLRWRT